jgi:RimJ/RimL family protein N-acetyltransferase
METFATARLQARRLAPSDLGDLVRLHLDPDVSRFIGGVRSPEATALYLERNLAHWDEHGFGLWVFRSPDGDFMGRAGLRFVLLEGVRELEIAYTFAKPAWGQGLATEVARSLVDLYSARPPAPSLVGIVDRGHSASEKVLAKSGFVFEREAPYDGLACGIFRRLP